MLMVRSRKEIFKVPGQDPERVGIFFEVIPAFGGAVIDPDTDHIVNVPVE